MAKRLTGKQQAMIDERKKDMKASNAEIVRRAGYKAKDVFTASQQYLENMKKPEIAKHLENYVEKAELGVIEIAEYSKDMGKDGGKEGAAYAGVALNAYKDIQDRVKGKATQRIEQHTSVVTLNLSLADVASQPVEGELIQDASNQ